MTQPLSRSQIEELAQANPRPLTKEQVNQLLKVERTQPSPTIQMQPLGDPKPRIERIEVQLREPDPAPKTDRQERAAAKVKNLLGLQLNPKQLKARNRRLRQLRNREKRPDDAYRPRELRGDQG
jgi:hypothetical protein